jgi:hypothetical protein
MKVNTDFRGGLMASAQNLVTAARRYAKNTTAAEAAQRAVQEAGTPGYPTVRELLTELGRSHPQRAQFQVAASSCSGPGKFGQVAVDIVAAIIQQDSGVQQAA